MTAIEPESEEMRAFVHGARLAGSELLMAEFSRALRGASETEPSLN
jgi:hypothetical protein